jgi:UDP-glucuronate decarboxylase
MKILVAGGAGFIGLNLVLKLSKIESNKIIVVDNLSTSSEINVKIIKELKNVLFIKGDICNRDLILKLYDEYQFNEVYNLACPASPEWYQKYPLETIQANTTGLINLLDGALKYKTKIIQSSTSEVYGDPLINPQSEEYFGNVHTLGPRSCYDEGKRLAETICYEYYKKGTDVRIARIFNTYGPWMKIDDGRVISNFINSSIRNKPLIIYGSGKQTRSFQYISDLLDGFESLMKCGSVYSFGPYNLGNTEEKTLLELASIIIDLTNSKSSIVHEDKLQDDPRQRKPSILKANYFLKWNPKVNLLIGLEFTINYFKNLV